MKPKVLIDDRASGVSIFGLVPPETRQAAIAARFPEWTPRTLDGMFDAAATEFPDRPYVITDDRMWTYRDMQEWSHRLASGLRALGVKRRDHVALVFANYPEFVALKVAIARVGAVAVPVNILNRRDELGYVLAQSDAVMLVTMNAFRDLDYLSMLDELIPGWEQSGRSINFPHLRNVIVFPTDDQPRRVSAAYFDVLESGPTTKLEVSGSSPDDVADIIYTSGTTGAPKGVMLTHDQVLRTAYGSAYARAFEDGRRIVFSLPMYHVYGYGEGMLPVMFVGGAIIPQLKFDAAAMLTAIEQHRATDALLVPTMTLAMLDATQAGDYDLSSLFAVISSGARAPERVWNDITAVFGVSQISTGYGMTEVTASSTVTLPNDPIERLLNTNGRIRDAGVAGDPENYGRLVDYRVVDPESSDVLLPGFVGELRAKGIGVTQGYYNQPEETAALFDSEGWLHTGDLGKIDGDSYIYLVGRLKESYRCGGEQVLPTEVEDLLTSHPSVIQAHVVPVPDVRMGEIGVAFVVPTPGAEVTEEELLALVQSRMARFKVPKYLFLVDAAEIPTTASGRAKKFQLSAKAISRLEAI
jgi:fatty-acyl-CoA synthase